MLDPVDVLRQRLSTRRRAQLRERERAATLHEAMVAVAQARLSAAVVACFVPKARPHVAEYVDSATDARRQWPSGNGGVMTTFVPTPLFAGTLTSAPIGTAPTVLYTVPANSTCILTELDLSEGPDGTSSNVTITANGVPLLNSLIISAETVKQWTGRLVLPAGATINGNYLTSSGADAPNVIISGLVG